MDKLPSDIIIYLTGFVRNIYNLSLINKFFYKTLKNYYKNKFNKNILPHIPYDYIINDLEFDNSVIKMVIGFTIKPTYTKAVFSRIGYDDDDERMWYEYYTCHNTNFINIIRGEYDGYNHQIKNLGATYVCVSGRYKLLKYSDLGLVGLNDS